MADGNVNQLTRNRLNSWQIQYYHEYYHGEDFGERYEKILKEELQIHDAALIETCIAEGMYEDAFDLVCEYGFEEAAPAKLLRMARNMILLNRRNTMKNCWRAVFMCLMRASMTKMYWHI